MIKITNVIKKCSELSVYEILDDSECKNYCIILHGLTMWDDLVETYTLLGKIEFFLLNILI